MDKIFLEKEYFYLVQTDSILNKNGILLKLHIDSLLNSSVNIRKSGYIDIPVRERFNTNKINFDIYNDCLYSLTSSYSMAEYITFFVKVPFQEINNINAPKTKERIKSVKVLSSNHEQRLKINDAPLSSNPYYYYPIDSSQTIYFDIAYLDSMNMQILVYNSISHEIENWHFSGAVVRHKERKKPFDQARWKSIQRYKLKKPLTNNFVATFIKGTLYIFTNDGAIYLANEKLSKVCQLPDNLDQGYIVFNKEKGEVHYIKKSDFKIDQQPLRELLKTAFKIDLGKE